MAEKRTKRRKGRRARGTGSIFFHEGRGRWVGRKPVGRTAKGKTLYVERWGETQQEVVKKLESAGPPGPNATIADRLPGWLGSVRLRTGTRSDYQASADNHILPELGGVKVVDLTPSLVESFAATLADKGLATNTVLKVLSHLRTILKKAVKDGLIPANPVSLADKPKWVRPRIDPFTPAELARIIAEAGAFNAGGIIALIAGTGCRVGEALGLDVTDFDRAAGTVSISRTFNRSNGLGETKSEQGRRTIRVPAPVLPYLVAAAGGRTSGPLFLSLRVGRRACHDLVIDPWGRLLKRLGLAYRNPHQLRHSVATALISAGDPPGDVAEYLGDTVETIVKTYLHATGTDPAATLERLLLGGRKVGGKPKGRARK